MDRKLYELVGRDDRRFSPYCWRTRMALAHKGLEAEYVPVRFTDKDKIAFSGQDRVPVLQDGDKTVFDSWTIAEYLEDTHPDRPSLFGGSAARGEARFINSWADGVLHACMIRMVVKDIHDHTDPADRAYFRESREKRFGATLEKVQADRDMRRKGELQSVLAPLRNALGAQRYLCGDAPAYGDYVVFGSFQWVRGVSAYALVERGDPIYEWRNRMLDLFDGLGRSTTAYPV